MDAAGNTGVSPNKGIYGTSGNDQLTGGPGEVLSGGVGKDTFVFHAGFGTDVITDFHTSGSNQDVIQFDHTIFQSFANVLANAAQQGSNVVITADATDTVTLLNVSKTALLSSNFHFV
jgi:Ca2+-binding RTX toxin-like protein